MPNYNSAKKYIYYVVVLYELPYLVAPFIISFIFSAFSILLANFPVTGDTGFYFATTEDSHL